MKHPVRWISAGLLATSALTASVVATQSSCGQTPTNVPVRTLEDSGRMDVVCMQVQVVSAAEGGVLGTPIPAIPVTQDHCTPLPTGQDPSTMAYHLVAVVTQKRRGEVAVVDLTAQHVVDTSRALPGINHVPVGKNPTDIAVTPDAQKVFVTSADPNKPGIYMIPSTHLLGDSEVLAEPSQAAEQVTLPTWPACSLPQAPGRMAIVPTGSQGYEIVVVMPGNGADEDALAGVIDTAAFDSIAPGSLAPCPIQQTIHLAENPAALPTSWTRGAAWPVGLPYVDGGIDLFASKAAGGVQPSPNYQLPLWSCPDLAHVGAPADAGAPDAEPISTAAGATVHGAGVATDGQFVYVADDMTPFVHVVDARTPGKLSEIAPFVATSITDPSRPITTSELAVSPVTRDYKRYLYAVDATNGSIIVYDITDPANGPRTPMTRPNPELAPFSPPDRITLGSPVSTIAFAHHDFAVPGQTGATATGVLCNPNPNAGAGQGVEYRANGSISVPLGPLRLRGVFAFATMTNGQVVAIDVDDWDSPCRRPLGLVDTVPGSLSVHEPNPTSSADTDPYHAPALTETGGDGGLSPVSNETMWPIIQPNRVRSVNLIEDDLTGTGGLHEPAIQSTPQLLVNGAPVAVAGSNYPVLTAALPSFFTTSIAPTPQPTAPNVYMAHDVPEAQVADQTWNVVYEGVLPGFDGIVGDLSGTNGFAGLQLSNPNAYFCGHGVEDRNLGLQRYAAMKLDDTSLNKSKQSWVPAQFDQRVGDYVQITDDILGAPNPVDAGTLTPDPSDPYWSSPQDCWGPLDSADKVTRQQTCIDKFGAYGADQNPQRDFPILQAYEDHLVLGRYLYTDATNRPSNGRIVAPPDTQTQVDFQLAKCCFHNQVHFHVRTGGEWVALGSATGYLHHVVPDPTKACVQSCDPRTVLMSSRLPETAVASAAQSDLPSPAPSRNSPFALRNPMFSFYLPAPIVTGDDAKTFFSIAIRDDTWQFMTRGQYGAEAVSLTGANGSVVPQSSMFIAPLGALGVVDGSANGLFVIDLNTLSIGDGSPFY